MTEPLPGRGLQTYRHPYAMRTVEQINAMLLEAKGMLAGLHIPVSSSVNPSVRFVKGYNFFGRCHRFCAGSSKGYDFEIQLPAHAAGHSDRCLMNTLLHELIHTAPGCFNHGPLFKKYGTLVNATYGYDISTKGGDVSEEDQDILLDEIRKHRGKKIVVECPGCGQRWTRYRECRLTLYPSKHICPVCGSRLRRADDESAAGQAMAPAAKAEATGVAVQLCLF